jgi:hypothetical protein
MSQSIKESLVDINGSRVFTINDQQSAISMSDQSRQQVDAEEARSNERTKSMDPDAAQSDQQ